MNLKIYNFFSYWIAVWFILFKLNVLCYSPYLIYLVVAYGITLKAVYEYTLLIKNKTNVNKKLFVLYSLLTLIVYIFPIYFLQPDYSNSSIIFTLVLLLMYCLIMELQNKNIITQYTRASFPCLNSKIKNIDKNIFRKII